VAAEEADESRRWLVRLVEANICTEAAARELIQEAHELTAIFVSSAKTARENQTRRKEQAAATRRAQLAQRTRSTTRKRVG
jgi:hypothetical protein